MVGGEAPRRLGPPATCVKWRSMSPSPTATGSLPPHTTPFVEIDRARWANLAPNMQTPLTDAEIVRLRGPADRTDSIAVAAVSLPLSRLLSLYVTNAKRLHDSTQQFLGESSARTPFVIGVAGSVAAGKSTVSRLLRE